MSKLAEFRRAERELQEQLALLERLQGDSGLKREMEFEEELKTLMADYGVDLAKVVSILDPQPVELVQAAPAGAKQRRARQVKVYLNPHSGARLETKGGNHAQLKAWKAEFGGDVVEQWLQA